MSILPNDIKDDEIRIISSERNLPTRQETHQEMPVSKELDLADNLSSDKLLKKKVTAPKWKWWMIISAIIFFGALCVFFWWEVKDDPEEYLPERIEEQGSHNLKAPAGVSELETSGSPAFKEKGFVELRDTVVGKVPLTIFTPKNLVPKLHVGVDALQDSTAMLVVQAADIRRDNGQIVGAYVYEGNLLSRGQSKAGFCAIINGKLIIGVADSTPYLEQAIENGGYFFRQFPLVVGGQVIDNKLKTSSLRKALAELNGETVVITTDKKQTLNEFSQTLVDLGVTNAIYLIGSTAPGFAIDENANRIDFGKAYETPSAYSNYIIWN